MNEVKDTLRRLAIYFLLLIIIMLPTGGLIPDVFPTRNISSLLLLTLSVCLFLRYETGIAYRGVVKSLMLHIAAMLTMLFLLRGIKYSCFTEVDALARNTWYFYYVPLLLIPEFFFLTALCIHATGTRAVVKKWRWTVAVTAVFIALVLTNDLHQWVFRFLPGFENWDRLYRHCVIFYILTAWEYMLYLAAAVILLYKCRLGTARRRAYLILIPLVFGISMMVLLFLGRMPRPFGENILQFPEINGFMVSAMLECCMALGLIPTNESHRELMTISSVAARITDSTGHTVYKSAASADLPPCVPNLPYNSQSGENIILRKKEIPGGFGFWQEDITELNRVNAALAEAKEKLSEEGNLIRLQTELREKQRKIEQRIHVYDVIARRTVEQSQQITALSETGLKTGDAAEKEHIKKQIILLGVYIKRYANLMILGSRSRAFNIAELGLSLAESIHYLGYYGITGRLENSAEGNILAESALAAFGFYEAVLEEGLEKIGAVFINLSDDDSGFRMRLNLEGVDAVISEKSLEPLQLNGIVLHKNYEDGITYLTLSLPKGGELV